MTISISELLKTFQLKENDFYYLYTYIPDGYGAFGYVGRYKDADEVERLVLKAYNDPNVYGIWVTVESGDGVKDIDVFKMMKGSAING